VISKFNFQRLKKGALKYLVLECLAEKPMRVYEIIKAIENKFEGFYRPSTGSIYPILKTLIDDELISVNIENGKKIYSITEKGKKIYEEMKNKKYKIFGDNASFIMPILQELLQMAFYFHENRSKIDERTSELIINHLKDCKEQIRKLIRE
jgi:DNA-binding PadR family transcriptional regulator